MSHFAGIAGRIEAVIGPTLTAKLLAARGGGEVTIPKRVRGSALAKIIGEEATRMLRDADDDAFGPGPLRLPMGNERGRAANRRAALAMIDGGASIIKTALVTGVHKRTVSRWKEGGSEPDPGPGPLFEAFFDKDEPSRQ